MIIPRFIGKSEISRWSGLPVAARAESGRKLRLVTDTYKGLQWETVAEEMGKETGNGGKASDTAKHAALLAPGIPTLEQFLHLLSGSLTFMGKTEGRARTTLRTGGGWEDRARRHAPNHLGGAEQERFAVHL